MSSPMSEKGRPVVPPDELRCVWMTAGVLSFQLCERGFDCEHCPLDAALRTHFARGAAPDASGAPPAPESGPLPGDRRWSRGHCWVKASASNGDAAASTEPVARVGLDPALVAALLAPREVVRPLAGERLERGQVHLWIVTAGGTLPIAAPVSGTVRRPNPALGSRPHLLLNHPLDDGWLYEVEPESARGSDGLMDGPSAERAYAEDARRFRGSLARALRGSGDSPVLADGGQPLSHVADMLGPERYFELLAKAFGRS